MNHIIGCRQCSWERRSNSKGNRISWQNSKTKFLKLEGKNYKVIEYTSTIDAKVKCLVHNTIFSAIPHSCIHRRKIMGCDLCKDARVQKSKLPVIKITKSRFINIIGLIKHFKVIGKYKGIRNPIKVHCLKHKQIFFTRPEHVFRRGYVPGCSKCKYVSGPERQILAYVDKLLGKEKVIHQPMWRDAPGNKGIIRPDIVIPHLKLVIEHNGLYHNHSAITGSKEDNQWKHHKRRQRIEALGYRVIYIWGDDWINRTQAIKRFLKALLLPQSLPVWDARKLKIKCVSGKFANQFFDKYHPQGKTSGGHTYIGLYDQTIKRTVAIMGFSTTSRPVLGKLNKAELTRFASRGRVRGGASRVLAHYTKTHPDIHTIVSFSDNDYFDGGMYPAIGFKFDGEVAPVYSTIWSETRRHKSYTKLANLARLAKLGKIIFRTGMTERICLEYNCIRRCWNSGKKRWIFNC